MSLENWKQWETQVKEAAIRECVSYMQRTATHWKSAGRGEYVCAIRPERTPSCRVYDDGHWYDFGIGQGGDLISFVRWRDSSTYNEALNTLAVDLGIGAYGKAESGDVGGNTLAHMDPDAAIEAFKRGEDERSVFETMTKLTALCAEMILHPKDPIRTYLRDHYGFTDAFITREKMGYVPISLWKIAMDAHPELTPNMLMQSGFFVPRRGDFFEPGLAEHLQYPIAAAAGRILLPYLRDGMVCYTIARKLPMHERDERSGLAKVDDWDRGKYKKHLTWSEDKHSYVARCISNEQLLYEDCGRLLRSDLRLYICEGWTDAAILRMLARIVMSPVTTNLSTKQIERALTYAKRAGQVVIVLDNEVNARGDNPGDKGAIKMARMFWEAGIRAKIMTLPRPEGVNKIDMNEFVTRLIASEGEPLVRSA